MREPRFDLLFEPLTIGPVTARNRFYQTPHCNGMGNLRPQAHAAMRGVKAEGGWAVVNTEHCSVHPTSDLMPEVLQTLWDDGDIPVLQTMVEAVHAHDALAGVQLAYAAYYNGNRLSREVPMGPGARPVSGYHPVQVRAMDGQDIRNLLRWWREAAARARTCGFDIVNVDANFSTIAFQFLSPRNQRTDEYGGPLKNRVRLLKELIEVSREGVKGDCAISVRLIVDELCGPGGLRVEEEGLEAIGMLAELPDLWDIVVGTWADDSPTSRFAAENDHEPFMTGIKRVTTKPVVGVGRFTSPDTMLSLVRRGVLDMIGAARPSIADPFLPKKIEEGRFEDIRECIGCNICVSSHFAMTNLRCTQNPTMGEEWRKGWHPETIAGKRSETSVLVVGAGPAGLECARALGQRGYEVVLAEKTRMLGGRISREAELPGLREWLRVRDWRAGQIAKMATVSVYLDSDLSAQDILSFGYQAIVLATGASWRADGVGRAADSPIPIGADIRVLTPDDIMAGDGVVGPVIVYDDDHYYMGSVVAEKLALAGAEVMLVTPASDISIFTADTLELPRTARRLHEVGVRMLTHQVLGSAAEGTAALVHVRTGVSSVIPVGTIVMVTSRRPEDSLFHGLTADAAALGSAGITSVTRIGDCLAPAAIFAAVYAGHRFAREFDEAVPAVAFKRERIDLGREQVMGSDKPLERYIRILEVISGFPDGIGLTPVAEILGLPKTSVHRLINGLVATAMIEPVEKGATAYRLGPRFATLFYSGAGEDWIGAVGQPLLKDLAAGTGQACFIAKLAGGVVRSVALVSPDILVRPHVLPGREIPLHTGASAKAILAFLNPAIALALLPRPLARLTGQTQTDPKLIALEWAAIRDSGVALCVGEDVAGFAGIAVPIAVAGQTVRYSLCLSGTIDDLISTNRDHYAELLQAFATKLAKSIAARLPGRPAGG